MLACIIAALLVRHLTMTMTMAMTGLISPRSHFQARSEAVTNMQARFSFNSKAAQETYAEAWDKRDPWRMLKKNVSFAAPRLLQATVR